MTDQIADVGMESGTLAGGLAGKLQAIRGAGFSQFVLSATDLVEHPGGYEEAVALVRASGLRVTALQALRGYAGTAGPHHDYKLSIARTLLEMCGAVGARLLLVEASAAEGDPAHAARDLRRLAMLAVPSRVRIGHVAGRGLMTAWDVVFRADAPNLGLALDVGDALADGMDPEDIEMLDLEKLFLVQLADRLGDDGNERVFPGEGDQTALVAEAATRLAALGYHGDYSLAVANVDYRMLPPGVVAKRAARAASWLAEDVLRLSAPLPGRMRLQPR